MQLGHRLEFNCEACLSAVKFSVFEIEKTGSLVCCEGCGKRYRFEDETLVRQLKKFEALCRQIHDSEEILGNTSIAIDMGTSHVSVPFNILLTRLSSVMELSINGKKCVIAFRLDPLKDVPLARTGC